jgi:hypothetical protein
MRFFLLALLLASCDGQSSSTQAALGEMCDPGPPCDPGLFCVHDVPGGECGNLCYVDADCGGGAVCVAGLCRVACAAPGDCTRSGFACIDGHCAFAAVDGGAPDLATADLVALDSSNVDLEPADQAMFDLAKPMPDISMPVLDLAMLDQTTPMPDLAMPDLAIVMPDLTMPDLTIVMPDLTMPMSDLAMACAASCPLGANPTSAVVADLDGDGNNDVAVTDTSGSVLVFLGNGDATLRPPLNFAADAGAIDIVAADFDGDGKLDLATANQTAGDASFLRNLGGANFAAPSQTALGSGPVALVAGDFNGDGKPDLALSLPGVRAVGVLLGDGQGGFQALKTSPIAQNVASGPNRRIAAGDLNSDGKLDVAVVNMVSNNQPPLEDELEVHLGSGDGTFQLGVTLKPGNAHNLGWQWYGWVAVADVDRDGKLDLVTEDIDNGVIGIAHSVAVFRGNGNGSFQAEVLYPTNGGKMDYIFNSGGVADFDGDGKPDVATADGKTWINITSPSLGQTHQPQGLPLSMSMRLLGGDLDGDGEAELIDLTPNMLTITRHP